MCLHLAVQPPEAVPVLLGVAGLLLATGASLTARAWYIARDDRSEGAVRATHDEEEPE